MLIPIYRKSEFEVGDIIISLEEIKTSYYIFSKYHEFTIIKDCQYTKGYTQSFDVVDNEHGVELKSQNVDKFTLKVDLETAKKRDTYLNNEYNLSKFILKNCPYKYKDIDDRDYYDACRLKVEYVFNTCEQSHSCIKYIDKELINKNKEISAYLRYKKMKNIEKASE
jgi:hypothetical protein